MLGLPRREAFAAGSLFRVRGPARLRVVRGLVYAIGLKLREGNSLVVRSDRVICCEALEESKVELAIGAGGGLEAASEAEEVIRKWRELAENIIANHRLVVVVGEVDSGKSTFSTILLNTAVSKGLKAAFLDEDVGQSDIAWPGVVGLAYTDKPVYWIRDLKPESVEFVGSTSPVGNEVEVITAVVRLINEARRKADFTVVNTDGWVSGTRAIKFKTCLVRAIAPDAVVVMKGDGGADGLARALRVMGYRVIHASSPQARMRKTKAARKSYRESALVSLLMGSRKLRIDLKRLPVVNLPIGGESRDEYLETRLGELTGQRVIVFRAGDQALIVTRERAQAEVLRRLSSRIEELVGVRELLVICEEDLNGAYVGLHGEHGRLISCGVIRGVDLRRMTLLIEAPLESCENIKYMVLGKLRIAPDGSEAGFLRLPL